MAESQSTSGNNTGIIIIAVLVIAALAVAAVLYMTNQSKPADGITAVVEAPAAVADKVTQ